MPTAYGVAFSGERFLMVFNIKRDGWEMPGGTIEDLETVEEAVKREFLEEAGYDIVIRKTADLGNCRVCACLLGQKIKDAAEMRSELFKELPEKLAFERSEYEEVIPWARSAAGFPDALSQ
jgi:8-oxo-dGTP diphosphatase